MCIYIHIIYILYTYLYNFSSLGSIEHPKLSYIYIGSPPVLDQIGDLKLLDQWPAPGNECI